MLVGRACASVASIVGFAGGGTSAAEVVNATFVVRTAGMDSSVGRGVGFAAKISAVAVGARDGVGCGFASIAGRWVRSAK